MVVTGLVVLLVRIASRTEGTFFLLHLTMKVHVYNAAVSDEQVELEMVYNF